MVVLGLSVQVGEAVVRNWNRMFPINSACFPSNKLQEKPDVDDEKKADPKIKEAVRMGKIRIPSHLN